MANKSIEKYKATEEFRKTFALVRVEAYKQLWSLMDTLSPAKQSEITEAERRALSDLLQTWYYQNGGYISFAQVRRSIPQGEELLLGI